MKRTFLIFLSTLIVFSCCSCGAAEDAPHSVEEPSVKEEIPAQPPKEEKTGNLYIDAFQHSGKVMNGAGNQQLGWHRYIEVKKSDALNTSGEDFADFVAKKIDGADAMWYTIVFDDGTGIVFAGCNPLLAEYGKLDTSDMTMAEAKGIICQTDDGTFYSYTAFD